MDEKYIYGVLFLCTMEVEVECGSRQFLQGMKSRFKYCIAAETKSIIKKKCIEIDSIIGK